MISGNHGVRSSLSNAFWKLQGNACISRVDGGLGFVRGYMSSVGAGAWKAAGFYYILF